MLTPLASLILSQGYFYKSQVNDGLECHCNQPEVKSWRQTQPQEVFYLQTVHSAAHGPAVAWQHTNLMCWSSASPMQKKSIYLHA